MTENDPPSLPSALQPTIVQITKTETPQIGISIPSKPVQQSNSSPTTPQSTSALGNGVQHTFYKPRATATAAARRSRTESLTNSLNNPPGGTNYPPSAPTSRPQSLARSRPPSASYNPSPVTPSASASLTHTNNILPPASFFNPKQPLLSQASHDSRPPPLNANNVYAPARVSSYSGGGGHSGNRPLSGISTGSSSGGGNANIPLVSSTSSHAREHGLIMLPLSHINSRHSDGSTSGPDLSSYSDSSQRRRLSAHGHGTRVKPSREALLPIGEKEALPGSGKSSTYTAVRGSLEKIFRRSASSSEKDRGETPTNKDQPRTVMDDHAQAASSLSVRLWRQPSVSEPATKPEPAPTTEPANKPAQTQPAPVSMPHGPVNEAPQPIAFEGVAIDGQRFTYGPEHNWQQFPSRNTFFLNGKLLTGGDSPLAFLFSLSVALGIGGTWFGTTAVWWWKYESPAVAAVCAYISLLTLASMLATALRDPGILPRDLDIDPPYPSTPPSDGGPRVPLPRDIHVRSGAVRVKYCVTCKIYRPPRSSHCKLCDNCVEGCDHHCPWVNNCIGRRNYTSFFTFLFCANLSLLLVIITSALHIYLLVSHHFVPNVRAAIQAAPGSVASFIMAILVLGPVLALFSYHVRLMLLNITTIEQVRNQAHRSLVPGPLPANPFTLKRWYRNLGYLMCRPVNYSYVEADSLVKHDHRLPNPGHDWSNRMGHDGFTEDTYSNHHSMWKDDPAELEMQHVSHGRTLGGVDH